MVQGYKYIVFGIGNEWEYDSSLKRFVWDSLVQRGIGSAMRTYVLCAVAGFILLTPSLVAQTSAAAPTPIPEEARRHFVMGETMFKEAKNVDAFTQAVAEFTEAARLAPQWPDARYDLALAKEAAGDYSGAMADLKLYQQFKLTDAEARTVQDKIYAIEAKQKMKVSVTMTDSANAPAAKATYAAPSSLICDVNSPGYKRDPTIIELNEAKGSVTIHFGAIYVPGARPYPQGGGETGPLVAEFGQDKITFGYQPDTRKFSYSINRLTGTVDVIEINGGSPYAYKWTCQVGNSKF
jgi:hypothetical protein